MYLFDNANKARCCYFIFVDIDINLNILPLTKIVVRVNEANCLTFINIRVDVTHKGVIRAEQLYILKTFQ